ncbi:hypothetical protein Ddye_018738 [Dipteronia dyeriana]|uniref:RED-like N-terminal domain-containing protein n=1 Tax=Dipteronia dyeriana TaxID=168575 RepID=A0AAD9UBP7_9ROSI|nr:hypothetical protein Ddye_018738 [Dipteronia dyeriana]
MSSAKKSHKEKISPKGFSRVNLCREQKAEEPNLPKLADAHKLSIEKSKYLGGDVEHTHLVNGLDYALLNKVRSETVKKPYTGDDADGNARSSKEDQQLSFRTAIAKSVYQLTVKLQTVIKTNEMFLTGRMSFIFNMDNDIPTTLHRSKADCLVPEEMFTVSVDGSVLD